MTANWDQRGSRSRQIPFEKYLSSRPKVCRVKFSDFLKIRIEQIEFFAQLALEA